MTRAIVVAESGAAMATVTAALRAIPGLDIVRYASGSSPVGRLARSFTPDVVIIDEPHRPAEALARLAEVRAAAPATAVVVLAGDLGAHPLAGALAADADAVLHGAVDPSTLDAVLREVLATPALDPRARLAA